MLVHAGENAVISHGARIAPAEHTPQAERPSESRRDFLHVAARRNRNRSPSIAQAPDLIMSAADWQEICTRVPEAAEELRIHNWGASMKSRIPGLLAVGLLAGPMAAHATMVTWEFSGVLTTVSGSSPELAGIAVGQGFRILLTFDSAAPLTPNRGSDPVSCGDGGINTLCRHSGPGAQMSFTIVQVGDFVPREEFLTEPARNTIIVRNNAPTPGTGVIVDGYSFSSGEYNAGSTELNNIGVILRGPEDLGVVTDGRVLPELPPPGMLRWGTREFSLCAGLSADRFTSECEIASLLGRIDGISAVPEPGTLALLGLGLAGLGLSRRRKAA